MTDELTLEDLAVQRGLTLRTLRFYRQEGLLPGPDTRGKYARYSQQHLDRLELIRRMKDLRLPLQEIRQLIGRQAGRRSAPEVNRVEYRREIPVMLHLAVQGPEVAVDPAVIRDRIEVAVGALRAAEGNVYV